MHALSVSITTPGLKDDFPLAYDTKMQSSSSRWHWSATFSTPLLVSASRYPLSDLKGPPTARNHGSSSWTEPQVPSLLSFISLSHVSVWAQFLNGLYTLKWEGHVLPTLWLPHNLRCLSYERICIQHCFSSTCLQWDTHCHHFSHEHTLSLWFSVTFLTLLPPTFGQPY